MRWLSLVCAVGDALLPAVAGAATPYYVAASGTAHTQAGNVINDARDDHSFNTGNLVQAQASGSQVAGAQSAFQNAQFVELTTASGSVTSRAEIGALHAYASASSDTGLVNTPYLVQNPGDAESGSTAEAIWSDTIHFRSFNSNGSDFVWSLGLDNSLGAGGSFYGTETGYYAAAAAAQVSFTQDDLGPLNPLSVEDRYTIFSNRNALVAPPTQRVVSFTFHAVYGAEYFATLTGTLAVSASAVNGTGAANADASNTALFSMYSADPRASYDTASGTVFATSAVAEPESVAALATACIALSLRKRRGPGSV